MKAIQVSPHHHQFRMICQQPQMNGISGLKALPVGLPQFCGIWGHMNCAVFSPLNLLLGVKGKQLLDQNMMAQLRIQVIRIPPLVNNGIGALPHNSFNMAVHSSESEDGMKFQWNAMIHENPSLS